MHFNIFRHMKNFLFLIFLSASLMFSNESYAGILQNLKTKRENSIEKMKLERDLQKTRLQNNKINKSNYHSTIELSTNRKIMLISIFACLWTIVLFYAVFSKSKKRGT